MFNIYALKCTDNKYYIGKTTLDVITRFSQHKDINNECSFTSKYHPIEIMEQYTTDDSLDEDKTTKKYMIKFGIENVRGGSYSKLILEDWQIKSLEHEFVSASDMCYKCKNIGHFAKDCSVENIEKYLTNFTTLEELENEIVIINNVYNRIQLLNEKINGTNIVTVNKIKDLTIYSSLRNQLNTITNSTMDNKRDPIKMALVTKINGKMNENKEIQQLACNVFSAWHSVVNHENKILNSCNYDSIPFTNKAKPINYDIIALKLLNYNFDRQKELKDIYVEYKTEDSVKNKLMALYEKKLNIMITNNLI